jgi:hypothetical protein
MPKLAVRVAFFPTVQIDDHLHPPCQKIKHAALAYRASAGVNHETGRYRGPLTAQMSLSVIGIFVCLYWQKRWNTPKALSDAIVATYRTIHIAHSHCIWTKRCRSAPGTVNYR